MNSQRRTKWFALFISLALLQTLAASTFAQQKSRRGRQPASSTSQRPTDEQAARRAQAINILIETASGARLFNDLLYRARIQTLAADALWSFDETRARQIFRRAWEAATLSDREEQRATEEEAGLSSNSGETTLTTARDEVLSKAAARDAKLADTFLREMLDERARAEGKRENQATRRTAWRELSPQGARRLALAYELLNKGDYGRAAQMAEPLINEGASGDLMEFLLRFRLRLSDPEANPDGYDGGTLFLPSALYTRLVQKTATLPYTDANDLLLLSSYLISPNLLMVVDERGGLQFRSIPALQSTTKMGDTEPPRAFFYNLAVSVLLRPRPSERAVNPVQDRIARYVATGRLIPLFEQEAEDYAQFVPSMRSQLAALSGEIEAGRRNTLDANFEVVSLNPKNQSDPLAPQLAELARATDKEERDRISLSVVRKAASSHLWDRAQRAAYSIEDTNLRRAALSFIVVNQIADITRAYKDDKEDDFEAVARFVRRADAPAFASAWGLAQAATIAARKGDREQVSALLTEAESYAARTDKDSRQRIAAYIILTDTAARLKEPRAWNFLSEVVSAVNSAGDYAGDEAAIATSTDSADEALEEELSIESDAFRLDQIFATMARLDFDKTLTEAQALTGETARAYARIAAARAALEKK